MSNNTEQLLLDVVDQIKELINQIKRLTEAIEKQAQETKQLKEKIRLLELIDNENL